MSQPNKKPAMGRGLSALLKDRDNDIQSVSDKNADIPAGIVLVIELYSIKVKRIQPRSNFNEENLNELAASIKQLGLIQPITVRKLEFNRYQLISGERRYRASKLVGLETIPAYIRIANDHESLEMALVENIQRQELDPIEVALSYQRLMDEIQLTQEQMSDRVGKKRSTIANYLRLLKLNPIIQTGMRDDFISMGHGRALINISDEDAQLDIYQKVVKQNLSVRDTENLVKKHQESLQPVTKTTKKDNSFEIPFESKKSISDFFSSQADVQVGTNGKGKISIPFYSQADFDRIIKLVSERGE